ncbi:MAG TPA: hypothetical protein VM597_02465 [Gemmataceae bacterium]|jgi:hypothetical protein|nr:hypothetical protein [Gemmataceae bacterium]
MTNATQVRFAPNAVDSTTRTPACPKATKVGTKVKRFLDALLRSLAAPAF